MFLKYKGGRQGVLWRSSEVLKAHGQTNSGTKKCIAAKEPRHVKNTQIGPYRKIMNNTMEPQFDRFVWARWGNMHALNIWSRGCEGFAKDLKILSQILCLFFLK